jgi:pimeloyl-ACP methyl ester carboxylesterase
MTLVLLPGLDGTGDLFAPFVEALGPTVDCIVLRYPPDQPLGYRALEAQVRAALPTDRPYVLLGESFSGPLAATIAASAPPGLCGLVMCVSFVRNPRPLLGRFRALLPWLPLHPRSLSLLRRRTLGRFYTPALQDALAAAVAQVASAVLKARLSDVLTADASAALAAVRVPVLVLQASDDRVVPAPATALLRRLQPQARHACFDAPHFLLLAQPQATAAVVARFLRDSLASAQPKV